MSFDQDNDFEFSARTNRRKGRFDQCKPDTTYTAVRGKQFDCDPKYFRAAVSQHARKIKCMSKTEVLPDGTVKFRFISKTDESAAPAPRKKNGKKGRAA